MKQKREEWIEHKNMLVFSLAGDSHPDTTVAVFAKEPFDFEAEHAAAEIHHLAPQVPLPLVRLSTLITMKQEAGRPHDQDDVLHLHWIADERDKAGLHE